ncbi:hypothetical protein JTE90_007726 [Oedothorax gibbosus]|uniref:Uncharacterized protein n=1 Tax=Oedothorax gibbosus TaxID=931172 RepID=A0AAV6V875_9ARAC|nr:hypothetical protein JTE90_007726 [Oedothorax gibbosus]
MFNTSSLICLSIPHQLGNSRSPMSNKTCKQWAIQPKSIHPVWANNLEPETMGSFECHYLSDPVSDLEKTFNGEFPSRMWYAPSPSQLRLSSGCGWSYK